MYSRLEPYRLSNTLVKLPHYVPVSHHIPPNQVVWTHTHTDPSGNLSCLAVKPDQQAAPPVYLHLIFALKSPYVQFAHFSLFLRYFDLLLAFMHSLYKLYNTYVYVYRYMAQYVISKVNFFGMAFPTIKNFVKFMIWKNVWQIGSVPDFASHWPVLLQGCPHPNPRCHDLVTIIVMMNMSTTSSPPFPPWWLLWQWWGR